MQKFIIFILLLLFCISVNSEGVIKVNLNKNKVKVGEVFTYTINIKGEFNRPKLFLPKFENFKIINQSKTQKYSFIGNKANLDILIIYQLIATKPGNFILEGASIIDNGRTIKAESLKIEVVGKPLKEKQKKPPFDDGIVI